MDRDQEFADAPAAADEAAWAGLEDAAAGRRPGRGRKRERRMSEASEASQASDAEPDDGEEPADDDAADDEEQDMELDGAADRVTAAVDAAAASAAAALASGADSAAFVDACVDHSGRVGELLARAVALGSALSGASEELLLADLVAVEGEQRDLSKRYQKLGAWTKVGAVTQSLVAGAFADRYVDRVGSEFAADLDALRADEQFQGSRAELDALVDGLRSGAGAFDELERQFMGVQAMGRPVQRAP